MGCDIHSIVELKFNDEQEEWYSIKDAVFEYSYFHKDKPVSWLNTPYTLQPFMSRNYTLFSILADVRNYHGWPVISQPRGLPKDAGEFTKQWLDSVDYHSHSYLTLRELVEAEAWDFRYASRGWVTTSVKRDYEVTGKTPNMSYESEEQFRRWRPDIKNPVYLEWTTTARELTEIDKTIQSLYNNLARDMTADDLRVVFAFDN